MRLHSIIPNFNCNSTQGPIQFYDWLGDSWCLLFSHPADFTPVCTTELGRIAVHKKHFDKRNVKVLAHSVDKLSNHENWIKDIKSYCPDILGDFPYPIIADPTRELAIKLEMIDEFQIHDPSTAETIRALFIIDPDKRLRLSAYYPHSTGRNVDEIIRCIDSMQLVKRLKLVATPANWVPGTEVMISPDVTDDEAKKEFPLGFDTVELPSGSNYVRTTQNYRI